MFHSFMVLLFYRCLCKIVGPGAGRVGLRRNPSILIPRAGAVPNYELRCLSNNFIFHYVQSEAVLLCCSTHQNIREDVDYDEFLCDPETFDAK